MKKNLITLFSILITLSLSAQLKEIPSKEIPEDYGYIVKTGQAAPDFETVLTDGTKLKLSDLKGKVIMLQFTASWCSVCRNEMPHIENEIWLKHKNRDDFALIGIDMDEPLDRVKEFINDIKISYPIALDPGAKIFYSFAAQGAGVTRNIIIDKRGKIVYMTRLFKQEEFDEMKEVIDFLLTTE
ncbi:MAG: TlpA family protein disulfide reductase [Prolixibacteraceae bacterium]|nr:TlpA family protein disulfide reductase [Prolixibacteraceae bacterium]